MEETLPRVNPSRSLANERNLAQRIAFERERLGMSYEGLARRMAGAGFPIQASAIFKIEKGDPPRRITVDEMVGFAAVFEIAVEELLVPVELLHERRLLDLYRSNTALLQQLRQLIDDLANGIREQLALVDSSAGDAAQKRVMRQMISTLKERMSPDTRAVSVEEIEAGVSQRWPEYVERAVEGLQKAISRWAKEGGN